MKMKQIRAGSMQEAMNLARSELGEDAVLLDTKRLREGLLVTFAIEEPEESIEDFVDSPADILPFTTTVGRATSAMAEINHPAHDLIMQAIRDHHVPQGMAEKLEHQLRRTQFTAGALTEVAESTLAQLLSAVLSFKPIATAAPMAPARAFMLVGPHGAGKTSALAKFATELTMHKKRVVLISCDNERLGASDALARLADILKCPFHMADSRAALKSLIAPLLAQSWVLIDTTGINIYEFASLKALGELAGLQGIEPILTCPAGMDATEAQEMAAVLDFLDIERMIVTRTDATRRLSSIFAALSSGSLALANMSQSALPSEACIPLSAASMARLMLRTTHERLKGVSA
jgi:flagellar biosynthesis protein FlhF